MAARLKSKVDPSKCVPDSDMLVALRCSISIGPLGGFNITTWADCPLSFRKGMLKGDNNVRIFVVAEVSVREGKIGDGQALSVD